MYADRRGADTDRFDEVASHASMLASRIETILTGRTQSSNAALSNFTATDVDSLYQDVESRWGSAGTETMSIVQEIKTLLDKNVQTATSTLQAAKNAVMAI